MKKNLIDSSVHGASGPVKFCRGLATALLLAGALAAAWADSPSAVMSGETVYVHLSDKADVTATCGYETWSGAEGDTLYFPIFGTAKDQPLRLLDTSGLEVDLNGKRVETIAPCAPPEGFSDVASGRRVFWFKVETAETLTGETAADVLQVRVRYSQALLGGRFYYLPVIFGQDDEESSSRPWAWQLQARSDVKVPRIAGPDADREQLRDIAIAYLHHGKIVVIER